MSFQEQEKEQIREFWPWELVQTELPVWAEEQTATTTVEPDPPEEVMEEKKEEVTTDETNS